MKIDFDPKNGVFLGAMLTILIVLLFIAGLTLKFTVFGG